MGFEARDGDGFLPDWNLGINIDKTEVNKDLLEVVFEHFQEFSVEFDRKFVVGYYDDINSISEDIAFITKDVDIDKLLKITCEFAGIDS